MIDDPVKQIGRILDIFLASDAEIRPHFILTGPSGSGKSHNIMLQCDVRDVDMIEINAAQLTKEGTAGNSLSKALTPLLQKGGRFEGEYIPESFWPAYEEVTGNPVDERDKSSFLSCSC